MIYTVKVILHTQLFVYHIFIRSTHGSRGDKKKFHTQICILFILEPRLVNNRYKSCCSDSKMSPEAMTLSLATSLKRLQNV